MVYFQLIIFKINLLKSKTDVYYMPIKKSLGKETPSDLIGHTMYKAPTMSTAAFYATKRAETQPKRQGVVLCKCFTTKSNYSSRGYFIADKDG